MGIRWIRLAGVLVVIAALAAALGSQLLASSSSTATSPADVPRSEHRGAPGERGALGEADGVVPDGTTVCPATAMVHLARLTVSSSLTV